jgi:phosphoenolpyruvate phosphomutase
MPDVNLVTMTESVEATRRMAQSVGIPVIVDADNGFGDASNTMRAVREFGLAGAAGICIEDNTFPKRCSLYPGAERELVSIDEMCQKVAAAKRAGEPFGMLVISRIESLIADLGSADAVERANAYAEAGADAVLVHSKSFAPLREIARSGVIKKPLVVVPTLFSETTFQEMADCGFAAVICANQMLRCMARACREMAGMIFAADSLADLNGNICTLSEINELVKVSDEWSNGDWQTSQSKGTNGKPHFNQDRLAHAPGREVSIHAG